MRFDKLSALCLIRGSVIGLLYGLCAAITTLLLYENENDGAEVDWEQLPSELWLEIGKRLVCNLDIGRFRLVCKKWHSSLPSPNLFPLFVPPPPVPTPPADFNINIRYFITELTNYYHTTKQEYIVTMVDQRSKFRPFVVSPDGTEVVCDFPHSHYRLFFHTRSHKILTAHDHSDTLGIRFQPCLVPSVESVVLISSDVADGVNPSYARASHLTLVLLLEFGRLALLRLRGSPQNWYWETDFCTRVFIRITVYKGQLCALDESGRVFLMDYGSLSMNQVCAPFVDHVEGLESMSFCVSDCGDVYLLDFSLGVTYHKGAYKLSFQLQKWIQIGEIHLLAHTWFI